MLSKITLLVLESVKKRYYTLLVKQVSVIYSQVLSMEKAHTTIINNMDPFNHIYTYFFESLILYPHNLFTNRLYLLIINVM